MSVLEILDTLVLKPIQLIFEVVYIITNRITGNPGMSIVILSLLMNFLVLPLYMRADAMQEEEREIEKRLEKGVSHIKKTFRGDERMMMLQTYYRQNHSVFYCGVQVSFDASASERCFVRSGSGSGKT